MITEQNLYEAIAECQGQRNPNANTCLKLASYYTILDHLKEKETETMPVPVYSYAAAQEPREPDRINYTSETDFGKVVNGRPTEDVIAVFDELMTTLQGMIPRLYEGVLNRLY